MGPTIAAHIERSRKRGRLASDNKQVALTEVPRRHLMQIGLIAVDANGDDHKHGDGARVSAQSRWLRLRPQTRCGILRAADTDGLFLAVGRDFNLKR